MNVFSKGTRDSPSNDHLILFSINDEIINKTYGDLLRIKSRSSLDSSNSGLFLAKKYKQKIGATEKQNVPHKRPILGCK
jgi:hypothetical protein